MFDSDDGDIYAKAQRHPAHVTILVSFPIPSRFRRP